MNNYDLIVFDWSDTLSPIDQDQLYDDVRPTLEQLHHDGYFLAIATMLPKRELEALVKQNDLTKFLSASATASDHLAKPNPQMLEHLMDFCGVLPQRTLMIGDSPSDMAMAQAAKTTGILIDRSYRHKAHDSSSQTIHSLTALKNILLAH